MALRVEITEEAERDALGILDWLISRQAGETGLRWFQGLEKAIASLATFPGRCPLAPENEAFSFEMHTCSTGAARMFTACCSPWKAKRFIFSTSGTAIASPSASKNCRLLKKHRSPRLDPEWLGARVKSIVLDESGWPRWGTASGPALY